MPISTLHDELHFHKAASQIPSGRVIISVADMGAIRTFPRGRRKKISIHIYVQVI
jgi:hypothetical protein